MEFYVADSDELAKNTLIVVIDIANKREVVLRNPSPG